jgi:septal ring factor EnvC (AmiA/AmiB activator)
MKPHTLIVTFLSAAALLAGCDKAGTPSQQLDKVQAETKEPAQDLQEKDYTFAQKSEFTEKMESQLAEINNDLEQLEAKIKKSSDTVKTEAKPRLQALREKSTELNKQIGGVKNATESTWDTVKNGTRKAYAALKEGFQQSRQWVSDKIAP